MHPYLAKRVLKLTLKTLTILEHDSFGSVLENNNLQWGVIFGEDILFHSPKSFLSFLISNLMELALRLVVNTVLWCYLTNLFVFGKKFIYFPTLR